MGLSATAQGGVEEIFEDVISNPDTITMLKFKSELEFTTTRSIMNGKIVALVKDESIINQIIENIKTYYLTKPSICFLDEPQMTIIKANKDA